MKCTQVSEELRMRLNQWDLPEEVLRAFHILIDAHVAVGQGQALDSCIERRAMCYWGAVKLSRCSLTDALKAFTKEDTHG